ncbi:MAG: M23 family metallopeptidase [Spirochaetaceae bacterium]|nr:M23 family metallopeptidase [Spirochaetaceae bacterium]
MKKIFRAITHAFAPALALVYFLLVPFSVQALSVNIPLETSQGDFITIYFYGETRISIASAQLLSPSGAVSQTVQAFPVDKQEKIYVAIIGIPTWSATGVWKVKASAIEAKKKVETEQNILVKKTNFEEYTLHLNESNTNLVTTTNPKKQEESQVLNDILTSCNLSAPAYGKKFIVPTQSKRITSEFAEKRTLVYNTGRKGSETHWGVDFGIPANSEVICPADGTVVFADDRIVTGGSLIIEHAPGVYTLFYHLNKNLKSVGDTVKAGEIVALSGNTGFSTGPHLHWEFRINSIPVSPFAAVERGLFTLE